MSKCQTLFKKQSTGASLWCNIFWAHLETASSLRFKFCYFQNLYWDEMHNWIYLRAESIMIKTEQFQEKPKFRCSVIPLFWCKHGQASSHKRRQNFTELCDEKYRRAMADGAKAVLNLTVIMTRIYICFIFCILELISAFCSLEKWTDEKRY